MIPITSYRSDAIEDRGISSVSSVRVPFPPYLCDIYIEIDSLMCGSGSCWYQFVVSKLEIWYRFYSRDICAAIFPSSQTYMMRIVSIFFEFNTFSELSQQREAKSSTGCCFEFGSQKIIVYWFWKKMREIWPTPSVPHLLWNQCPFFKSQFFRWKYGLKRLRIHGGSSPSIQSSSVPPAKLRMACTSIETSAANVTPIIDCRMHFSQSAIRDREKSSHPLHADNVERNEEEMGRRPTSKTCTAIVLFIWNLDAVVSSCLSVKGPPLSTLCRQDYK